MNSDFSIKKFSNSLEETIMARGGSGERLIIAAARATEGKAPYAGIAIYNNEEQEEPSAEIKFSPQQMALLAKRLLTDRNFWEALDSITSPLD